MSKVVRIGNASGFWGDDPFALKRQLAAGNLDYVNADYLAEVSMSILRKLQNRDPEKGYVQDFLDHVSNALDEIKNSDTKIITNAGGNNPIGCALALQKLLKSNGVDRKIFAITGDNIIDRLDECVTDEHDLRNMEDGKALNQVQNLLQSANVYTGSIPVAEAFGLGADIVIAGRISDSALTIGPLMHEFGWQSDDWNKLSAGMIAGHIIECGSQASGGNFTDWRDIPNWKDIGFPIIEMEDAGDFIVTKPKGSGGLVNEMTVKEQLVYEIHDPENYMGPDVIADVTSVALKDLGDNRVRVTGAKGKPSPPTWKVSMSYQHGWKSVGSIIISAPDTLEKAQVFKDIFWQRVGADFEKTATNFIGYDAAQLGLSPKNPPNEILLQFVAFDADREKLDLFGHQLAALILAGPPGVAVTGGRPKPQEVLKYWPALVDRTKIISQIHELKDGDSVLVKSCINPRGEVSKSAATKAPSSKPKQVICSGESQEVPLSTICLARSGDKGNTVNIGVIARSEKAYAWLEENLTDTLIKDWFSSLCKGEVIRYQLENLHALNFHLMEALDGGGTHSSRMDPQGKSFASALLNQRMKIPKEILEEIQ